MWKHAAVDGFGSPPGARSDLPEEAGKDRNGDDETRRCTSLVGSLLTPKHTH